MSRKIEVSPDIDLLIIGEVREQFGMRFRTRKETIGYETKLLTYRKNWNRFDYRSVYQGLGESLLYFNYGLEKVFLVMGFDTNSVPEEHWTKLIDKITEIGKMLIYEKLDRYLGLRIIQLLNGSVWSDTRSLSIKGRYHSSDKDFRFRRQCLIDGEFSYSHKLYDKIYH